MNLITILLILVALLAISAGFSIMTGSAKNERRHMAWFFVGTLGAALWGASIAIFLILPPETPLSLSAQIINGIYLGAIVMDVGMLICFSWQYRVGKILSVFFTLFGIFLGGMLLYNPGLLYSEIVLDSLKGNSITIAGSWYYWVYAVFFILITAAFSGALLYKVAKATSRRTRIGNLILMGGLMVAGILALIFDLILPVIRYDLVWVGPLSVCFTVLVFYYSILKYHTLVLSSTWMRILSFAIILLLSLIIYMLIFFLVFSILFQSATPSLEVFILNFAMIAIILSMIPIISEVTSLMSVLINLDRIEVAYIVKKLEKLNPRGLDKEELAGFLSEYAHFSYIGFLIDGKLYGSATLPITQDELRAIEMLKVNEKTIWQDIEKPIADALANLNIRAVAELRDDKSKGFGQILIGEQSGGAKVGRSKIIQMEMIINLTALLLSSGKRKKK